MRYLPTLLLLFLLLSGCKGRPVNQSSTKCVPYPDLAINHQFISDRVQSDINNTQHLLHRDINQSDLEKAWQGLLLIPHEYPELYRHVEKSLSTIEEIRVLALKLKYTRMASDAETLYHSFAKKWQSKTSNKCLTAEEYARKTEDIVAFIHQYEPFRKKVFTQPLKPYTCNEPAFQRDNRHAHSMLGLPEKDFIAIIKQDLATPGSNYVGPVCQLDKGHYIFNDDGLERFAGVRLYDSTTKTVSTNVLGSLIGSIVKDTSGNTYILESYHFINGGQGYESYSLRALNAYLESEKTGLKLYSARFGGEGSACNSYNSKNESTTQGLVALDIAFEDQDRDGHPDIVFDIEEKNCITKKHRLYRKTFLAEKTQFRELPEKPLPANFFKQLPTKNRR